MDLCEEVEAVEEVHQGEEVASVQVEEVAEAEVVSHEVGVVVSRQEGGEDLLVVADESLHSGLSL